MNQAILLGFGFYFYICPMGNIFQSFLPFNSYSYWSTFSCLKAGEDQTEGTWRERLHKWREILGKERLTEQLNSLNAKYAVEFDMKEVENSLRKNVAEKATAIQGTRSLWIAKRWWRYRPKFPYNYFLDKLDSSEVSLCIQFYCTLCSSTS